MGKIIAKHHTWAPGAKKFAFWLARVDGLEKVIQGNIRSSHVKAGTKRQPDVQLQDNAVLVTYYRGGMIQRFFAHPVAGLSTKGAARRIRKALKQLNERGGVGQSSKVDIAIPEHIDRQRRSEVESQPVPVEPTAPPLTEAGVKTPTGAAGEPVVFKSADFAAAYAALLAWSPNNAAGSFQMTSPQTKLAEVLGSNKATYAAQSLKAMGLLIRGSKVVGTLNTFYFTVSLRPYRIEPRQRRERTPVTHGAPQRRAKTQPTRKGGSRLADLVQQLEDAHGSVQRLTTLIHDQGFTVTFDKDGKVKLGVK